MLRATKQIFGLMSLGFLLAGSLPAAAQMAIYKSVDENGNVVFTDRPPVNAPAAKVTELDLPAPKQSDPDPAEAQQAGEGVPLQASLETQRKDACRKATDRLSRLKNTDELYRDLPSGEREFLRGEDLEAARADAQRSVTEYCS